MDSINKMMSESERLRKSLGFMEEHTSALQEFQKNYPRWQDEYKHATDIRIAGEKLLAMQGINKNILGLQSTLEQSLFRTNSAIAESQKCIISFYQRAKHLDKRDYRRLKMTLPPPSLNNIRYLDKIR